MIDYNYKVRNGQNKSWEDLEMIEFIISILVPILGGLGVSEADVTTYVTNCSGYIYAILISILVLIVLFSPTKPIIEPYGREKVTFSNAKFDLENVLETCCNSKIFSMLIRPPDRIKPTTPSIFQGKYYLSVQSLRRLVNVPLQYVVVLLDKILCFVPIQNSPCQQLFQ